MLHNDLRPGKKLVLHQRELIAVTPAARHDRLAALESVLDAFDGVFMRLPACSDAVMKPAPLPAQAIAGDLAPVYDLRPAKLRFSFAIATMQHELDPYPMN